MSQLQESDQPLTENAAVPQGEKPKRQLTGSLTAKVAAFILLVVMVCLTVISALGALLIAENGCYATGKESFQRTVFEGIADDDMMTVLDLVTRDCQEVAAIYCAERNIAFVSVESADRVWSWSSGQPKAARWSFSGTVSDGTVQLALAEDFTLEDSYALAARAIKLAYALRYWIYVIIAAAAVLAVVCFVFLLCASGHHTGETGVRPGWGTKIPLDVLTVGGGLGVLAVVAVAMEPVWCARGMLTFFLLGIGVIFAVVVLAGYSMSLALRIKLGGWWRNTVIYWALRLLCRGSAALGRTLAALFRNLPLVWKTAAVFGGLCFVEACGMVACWWEMDNLVIFWAVEKLLLLTALLYAALILRRLQKGGEALAAGDLSYQVDTRRMIWDFKKHGDDLNSIAAGMTRAVDQRMKSERMKTELITNVSHDIKTPLTSIINYADLIGKEPSDNEKITEYAGVLLRQSERLKKLIEDLVEASKASTGNLEVVLAPCEVGVLLTQAAGEYEQRLSDAGLTLVTRQPEHPVTILADGRRLWRIFDNLMNNICKYALGGTRVYLTLEEREGQAVISFKNTSRSPLDVSEEDLMERFVRGDASRSTEGNGLGLSIAKSLTDLQNGAMELTVDGDLFKVVLRFPLVS
jgi:signal transduction histidine kinase